MRYWNPYVAGAALGLVLLASFVVTGKGLGGSGAIKRASAAALHEVAPTWSEENDAIGKYFAPKRGPLNSWIVFLGVGVLLGGLGGALTGKRLKLETVHGPRVSRNTRLVLAIVGGIISGAAAQIARGCTSGQALTGGAQLALGSWVFMFSMFGAAFALAYVVRKEWI